MVRTRSKSLFFERPKQATDQNEISREIKERAEKRIKINPKRSPRKLSVWKQKQKAKRDSKKFTELLSNAKKSLSKV